MITKLKNLFNRQKKAKKLVWNDTQIDLHERQMAAREAMGLKWKCHPANGVRRKLFYKGVELQFDAVEIPTAYPPKLTLVRSR